MNVHSENLERQLKTLDNPKLEALCEKNFVGREYPFSERARIANTFFFSSNPISEEDLLTHRRNIIADLVALCSRREVLVRKNSPSIEETREFQRRWCRDDPRSINQSTRDDWLRWYMRVWENEKECGMGRTGRCSTLMSCDRLWPDVQTWESAKHWSMEMERWDSGSESKGDGG